jgi:uncharacterized DUF497 family protein
MALPLREKRRRACSRVDERKVAEFNCRYGIIMLLEFDLDKNAKNIRERGIGFERFADLNPETAIIVEDTRRDYGERRARVWGIIDQRLHVAIVTARGERVRVISLRRANAREERVYAKERQSAG